MSVFNRRNAFIGWLVITLAKPIAAGLMFWRKRHSGDTPADS
jgi:hypothetical protein